MAGLAVGQMVLPGVDDPAVVDGLAVRRPPVADLSEPAAYPGILARPLFDSHRRPEAELAADPDGFHLLGIGTAKDVATALLALGDGTVRRILPGAMVEEWRVEAIAPDHVVLSRDDEKRVLPLKRPAAPDLGVGHEVAR